MTAFLFTSAICTEQTISGVCVCVCECVCVCVCVCARMTTVNLCVCPLLVYLNCFNVNAVMVCLNVHKQSNKPEKSVYIYSPYFWLKRIFCILISGFFLSPFILICLNGMDKKYFNLRQSHNSYVQ